MTIRFRFLILLISAVILPVTLVAILAAYEFRVSAIDSFKESSLSEIQKIDQTFSQYLSGLAEDVKFLASSDALKALDDKVTNYKSANMPPMNALGNSAIEANAYRLLSAFGESHKDLTYVYLGLDNGGYIQWPQENMSTYDPTVRPWYISAKSNMNKAVRTPAYRDFTSGAPILGYTHTFNGANGLIGAVGIDVTLSKLTNMVNAIKFGEEGYVILVEETGRVLADSAVPDNNFKELSKIGDDYNTLANASDFTQIELAGRTWFASIHTSPVIGWKFIGLKPESEVLAATKTLELIMLVISIVLAVVFIFIGYFMVGVITNPINRVTAGMDEVA